MKTNIITINTIMTKATKYICAIVLMFGMSVSAWGTATITFSPTSKTINIDATTAEGYFVFDYTTTNLVNPYGNDGLQLYIPAGGTHETYDCGFGTTSSDVGYGHYTTNSLSSGKIVVSYNIDAEGDYSVTLTATGYTDNSYNYIQQDFVININVHKSCTDRTISFEDDIEKDFGTSAAKYQDYTLSAGSGTITWSSDDPTIASVASDGVVTLHKAGWTYINVAVAANGGYCADEAFYKITVNALTPTLSNTETGKEFAVTNITSTGATFSGGVVTLKGNASITRYGFVIGTSSTVVVGGTGDNAPVAGAYWSEDINLNTAFGSKTATTNFEPNTTYYARPFAYNGKIYGYGAAVQFTTLQRYAVTYYKNDGGATSEVEYKDHGVNYTVSSDKFSRDHYTLSKWHTLAAGTGGTDYAKGATYSTDAALNLYAVWTIDNHTISFDKNGGTGAMDNVVKAYNTTYDLPACGFTAPAGKVFDHWGEGSAGGTSRAVGYTHTVTADITFYAVWRDATYTNYTFACADLNLTAPANDADNVLRDTVYLTSTAEQKVRSLAKFHVSGTGLTASKEVKFTTGSDDLDAVYSFKKADGTAVTTNASGSVNEDVYIFYQPTATSDGRDIITAAGGIRAYVERNADGGKPRSTKNTARTISGRHLPAQFIIAAKAGDYWYALPADMLKVGAQGGYSFTPDNSTTPTQATIAPKAAVYNLYGFATSSPYDSSFVRFAGDNDHKALWSNKSNSSVGIKNNAGIAGGSAKDEQYEWRLTNTGPNTYNLWNHAANLTGRYLGLKTSDRKWSMYADASGIVKELRILPIENISAYIGLLGDDWEESAFTYTKLSGEIPSHHHVQITYNGDTYTATESGTKITITDDDFSDAGGFTAAPGTQLTVEWCSEEGAVLAQGALFSPIIVSSNTENLSDYDADALAKTDIFITNKSKLTINTNTTVHDVTVTSGATLFIDKADESTGATLTLSNGKLALRGGWNSDYSEYDMPRVYINPLSSLAKTNTAVNFDISVDSRNYYPFAVPFPVAVSAVDYVNPTLAGASQYGKHYVIKEYDGAWRAENGVVDDNWKIVNDGTIYGAKSDTLKPGKGYILTGVSVPAYGGGVIRFPMSFANAWTTLGEQATDGKTTKNVLTVTHHTGAATEGGGANNRHKGWNMLGVPFMSCYTSGTDMYTGEGTADLMTGRMTLSGDPADPYAWESGSVVYVSVPTHDFSEYIQTDITSAKLLPGWSFFIQVGTTGNLSFLTTQQREDSDMPIYAPARTTDSTQTKIRTGVILSSESGEASDKFGLIISDRYTSDYEVGADLEKLFGNGYTLATYSLSLGTRLAFNALSTADAAQVIPVGYRAPADGQYTFALNPRYPTDGLLRLELIDYQTGDLTDLLTSSYTFTTARTQDDTRFAIHAVYTDPAPATPTGAAPPLLNPDEPLTRKFILNGQLYIQRGQTIYDASGKEVRL